MLAEAPSLGTTRVFNRLDSFLRRQPPTAMTAAGLVLVAVLGVLDYATGPDLSFLIFYVGPVLFLLWYAGRGAALLATLLSAAFWTFEDVLSAHAYASRGIAIWNVAVRLGFFVFLVQMVAQLKVALEQERLAEQRQMEREVEIAQAVQRRLFPNTTVEIAGLDLHGLCRPVQGVAGDYYDFVRLRSGELGIAVGDVAGKGISAALLMASLQASLRSYISVSRDGVGPVTREINRQLYALTEPARFATLFWGIFDANRRTLKYSNAGQNPPLLLRDVFADSPAVARRRSDVERLRAGGVPLGAFAEAAYREDTVVLRPGDLLAIFTDGITEALDAAEEEFGDERLERLLRENANLPAADLCRIVMEAVDEHLAGIPPKDDMTLVIARVLPL
jgi:serine phosphatase RsbU (regulator of sigma subunit)